ncbi:DUF5709 domain-containing protein [Janibacter cremeus]|uniref:DUF5709 domain-containing protein n=1 Tax=Janibacter cremeus TaxID=1285192 RepID=UPI0023F72927|nr:DUF5709 domain-containing protein [Janibacter cremeus]WEV77947.1 DUF5709 domain-containing protein [Janibacter cremeus]
MSEPENLDTDLTSYSLDDEDQLQPEDTLTGTGEPGEDALDTGYSPPDSARGSYAHGVTAGEQEDEETIDERIKQEVPDPHSAYGAPDNESGLDRERSGGDDQDSIDADDDWLGDAQIGDERAGRLVGPDQGGADDEDQSWATDAGVDGGAASAEEAAVHVIDGDSTDRGDRI